MLSLEDKRSGHMGLVKHCEEIISDEEGESEEIIKEDFLDICRKRGLIC